MIALSLSAVIALSAFTSCSDKDKDNDKDDKDDKEETSIAASADEGSEDDTAKDSSEAENESSADSVSGATSVSAASFSVGKVTLTEVGSFKDSSSEYDFYSDTLYKSSGVSRKFCDYLGNEIDGGKAVYAEALSGTDYYCYYEVEGDMAFCGLMDAEGNIILPCKDIGLISAIGSRFLMVFYPEGTTTDENECIYYATSALVSLSPGDGDTMYTGYIRIFDTETRTFFDSVKETKPFYADEVGSSVCFTDSEGNKQMLGADGKPLTDDTSEYSASGSVYTKTVADGKAVYDGALNELFTTEYYVYGLDGDPDYLQFNEDSKYGVMDMSGNVLIEPKYEVITSLGSGYFKYKSGSGYGVVRADGKEIVGADYELVMAVNDGMDAPDGFFVGSKGDTYDLIGPDGVLCSNVNYSYSGLVIANESGDGYLAAATGEYSIKGENAEKLNGYLVKTDDGIYETVTGEKLLSDFDSVYTAYGCIYVKTGDEVKVYKPSIS